MVRAHWEDTLTYLLPKVSLLMVALVVGDTALHQSRAQRPDQTKPLVDQSVPPSLEHQRDQTPPLVDQFAQENPTAAELRTVASALLLNFRFEEYEFRSAAEAMPAEKYGYRPAQGDYGGVYPGYGPK